jgi:hypothetical protein
LKIQERFLFIMGWITKKYPIFYTGAISWDNRIHLWAPFFRFLVFPVLVTILRKLFRRVGNEFRNTEGGFCP